MQISVDLSAHLVEWELTTAKILRFMVIDGVSVVRTSRIGEVVDRFGWTADEVQCYVFQKMYEFDQSHEECKYTRRRFDELNDQASSHYTEHAC